jgi:hypothetical protein
MRKRYEFGRNATKRSKSRRKDENRDDTKTPSKKTSQSLPPLHFEDDKPKVIKTVIDPNGPYYNGLKRQLNDKDSISVHHPFFKKNNIKYETKNKKNAGIIEPLTDRSKTLNPQINPSQFNSNSINDRFSLPDINLISQKLNTMRNDGFNTNRDFRDAAFLLTKNYENNKFANNNNDQIINSQRFFDGTVRNDNASLLKLQYHMNRNSNLSNKLANKPNEISDSITDNSKFNASSLRKLGYVTQDYKNIIPNRKTPSSFGNHSRYDKESNNNNNKNSNYNPNLFIHNPNQLLSRLGYANDYFDNILL